MNDRYDEQNIAWNGDRSDTPGESEKMSDDSVDMISGMRCAAQEAANLLSSIGSSHRLLILCLLTEGEKTVTEIGAAIQTRQSQTSQHLTRLRLDGLVNSTRRGRFVYYSLADTVANEIIHVLYRHLCEGGENVNECGDFEDENPLL